jgi:1,4-alpha-glucan branching enzyme
MKNKTMESVSFEFIAPNAKEVCIAGSFNDWHPSVAPMISIGSDRWAKELTLRPGRYEYRFVVDGKWTDDPAAKKLIPNPFGSANAVLEVRPGALSKPSIAHPQPVKPREAPVVPPGNFSPVRVRSASVG